MNREETVQLDTPEAGARGGAGAPVFATASSDGSKVFFTDSSRLTKDSTAVASAVASSGGGGKPDLYMCEVGEVAGKLACSLKDLTVDHNAGEAAEVLGTAIGAGEDGKYVYFVANGVLAEHATSGTCGSIDPITELPFTGQVCNLYVENTATGETRFVAGLARGDSPDWEAPNGDLQQLSSGVSPDGQYLAFMSERSLTGYDNIDAHSGQPAEEVYLYDANTGHLVCASCNPTGARPDGVFDPNGKPGQLLVDRPDSWHGRWLAGSLPGWTGGENEAWYRSRYLSDSGRLFFDSPDGLVPGDANGEEDVYEYEPGGVGSCKEGGVGCVGLISSGASGEESAFLDAGESGDDVFFLTAARLAPQDVDGALDVYDAHVCSTAAPCSGGSSVAQPPPCGSADACRAAQAPQPGVFGAPPSATFSGPGNLVQGAPKPVVVVKKKGLTVAQKLAGALRKCRAKPKRRRAPCEARARKSYRTGVGAKRSRDAVTTKKGKG